MQEIIQASTASAITKYQPLISTRLQPLQRRQLRALYWRPTDKTTADKIATLSILDLRDIDLTLSFIFLQNVGGRQSPQYQYNGVDSAGDNGGFMLVTDFEVFYDIEVDDDGEPTCTLNNVCGIDDSCDTTTECAAASTFSQAQGYSTVSI